MNVAPHVAAKARRSAVDGRTTRHAGYKVTQIIRKRIEEVFGWTKSAAGFRKTRHRGLARVGWQFTFTDSAVGEALRDILRRAVRVSWGE